MKSNPLNLSGRTNLHELLSLIKNSELLISPDSGPIHIATCVNKARYWIIWRNEHCESGTI
jgi:ADP-heptose:LPS heptosyltransferase